MSKTNDEQGKRASGPKAGGYVQVGPRGGVVVKGQSLPPRANRSNQVNPDKLHRTFSTKVACGRAEFPATTTEDWSVYAAGIQIGVIGLGSVTGHQADAGHAGEHLADAIAARGITAYRLALSIGVTQPAISQILSGKRGITAQMALRLGRYFGTSPQFWMNLQVGYDLDRARAEHGAEIDAIVPLPSEMTKGEEEEEATAPPPGS